MVMQYVKLNRSCLQESECLVPKKNIFMTQETTKVYFFDRREGLKKALHFIRTLK